MIALNWLRAAALTLGALLLGTAQAEPVALDGTEQWLMTSAEGREYRIMISLPEGEVPTYSKKRKGAGMQLALGHQMRAQHYPDTACPPSLAQNSSAEGLSGATGRVR